jgi:hypothetical protein
MVRLASLSRTMFFRSKTGNQGNISSQAADIPLISGKFLARGRYP